MPLPRTRAWALTALLLAPTSAAGQSITPDMIRVTLSRESVNIAGCPTATVDIRVITTAPGLTDDGSRWVLEIGDGCAPTDPTDPLVPCSPGVAGCCQQIAEAPVVENVLVDEQVSVRVSDLTACAGDARTALTVIAKVRSIDLRDREVSLWAATPATLSLALTRPDPPAQGPTADPGETSVTLDWAAAASADLRYRAYVVRGGYVADAPLDGQQADDAHSEVLEEATVELDGLEEATAYSALVATVDAAGNESVPSPATAFLTLDVRDFYEAYREDSGGGDPGGFCETAPGSAGRGTGALAALAALGLVVRRRRRRP